MSHRALFTPFVLITASTLILCSAAARQATKHPPEITGYAPDRVSADSVIEVEGYRLGAEDTTKVRVFFVQGSQERAARAGGSRRVTNDVHGGPQSIDVVVPEGVTPGACQVRLEVPGHGTVYFSVEVVGWEPPVIERLSPPSAAPGDFVWVWGRGFHVGDEINLTDARGRTQAFESGASATHTGFTVPKDMPDGAVAVRVGRRRHDAYSRPSVLTVTAAAPLPPEVRGSWLKPVAPGQWVDLVVTTLAPLERSELTEVLFIQGERRVIAPTRAPGDPRVRVPPTLAPGEVSLQARTWRGGRSSDWSAAVVYRLSESPVAPAVEVVERGDDLPPVHLSEGPDRPESFTAEPGQRLTLRGAFPVETAEKLTVVLEGGGRGVELPVREVERGGVGVTLPAGLDAGEWRLVVISPGDSTRAYVPAVMRVERK